MQFGLLGCALLVELSDRKRRPAAFADAARPAVDGGEPTKAPAAERAPSAPARVRRPFRATPPVQRPPAPARPIEHENEHPSEAGAEPLSLETQPEALKAGPEVAPSVVEAPAATVPETEVAEPQQAEAAEPAPIEAAPKAAPKRLGFGLRRTRDAFMGRIRAVLGGGAKLDQMCEELEEALIAADVGVEASMRIIAAVRDRLKHDARPDAIREALKAEIERILAAVERPGADSGDEPLVVMLVGVNGVGKTTTVAKLATMFKLERGPVIVAAADTFRAAAIEQLEVWCKRVGAEIIKQKPGSDPAAIAFDAVAAARARSVRTVLIDTAGRLQTKTNLMEELKKIARVVGRSLPGAPHETWLVLDATTGQNALSQAKVFKDAVALTGVVLAKLDSTAKGGVIVAVAEQMKLPVRYVGLGESVEDLRPFDAHEFVEALFESEESANQGTSGSYAA
ncbi:MAG: signal recognition particle-docking protein FtsY [Candidatus Binataceae bacterium]|nr:signal recognition particle-docking protein FtsY [Candidatus Binataceae bacterium]